MERILIIGTGGVGGYFGSKIAQAGFDVTFVARGSHFEAIKEKGLFIKSIKESFHLPTVKVIEKISEIEQVDMIFLCTKLNQVEEVAKQLPAIIHEKTIVIPLLNGITAENQLSEHIAKKNIVHGLVKIFSKIERDGLIHHFGGEPILVFGNFFHKNQHFLDRLERVIKNSKLTYKRSENILSDKWKKFILICSGGLTTLSRATYGEIREHKETRQLLINLLQEIKNLGVVNKIDLPEDLVNNTLKMIDNFPYEATSSMQRDFYNKKPSELDFLTGEVVRLALKHNISIPVNQFIYSCLKIHEERIKV
ncbi:MAG: ketopantoate reductase family protein [Flavobacteriales bacterium]